MQPLRTYRVAQPSFRSHTQRMDAQYYPDRSNGLRHIYYSRRLRRWLAVSNAGLGQLIVNEYSECPCGATK